MPASIPARATARFSNSARQITAISKLNDLQHGISSQPRCDSRRHAHQRDRCRRHGGNRRPHHACETSRTLDRKLRALKPVDKRCKLDDRRRHQPPAHGAHRRRRRSLQEGASDRAADRLEIGRGRGRRRLRRKLHRRHRHSNPRWHGRVGEGAHAVHEHILISELPRRALLLAGMIESA